jgi:hypothetical protein
VLGDDALELTEALAQQALHGLTDPPVQLLALAPLAMSTPGASDRSLLAPAMRSMVVRP